MKGRQSCLDARTGNGEAWGEGEGERARGNWRANGGYTICCLGQLACEGRKMIEGGGGLKENVRIAKEGRVK